MGARGSGPKKGSKKRKPIIKEREEARKRQDASSSGTSKDAQTTLAGFLDMCQIYRLPVIESVGASPTGTPVHAVQIVSDIDMGVVFDPPGVP